MITNLSRVLAVHKCVKRTLEVLPKTAVLLSSRKMLPNYNNRDRHYQSNFSTENTSRPPQNDTYRNVDNVNYMQLPLSPMFVEVSCGELRSHHEGLKVRISGRVHFQRNNRFLTLRDSHGVTQIVVQEGRLNLLNRINKIPMDSHICIVGWVQKRPADKYNSTMLTGEIEVVIEDILNVASSKRKFSNIEGGDETTGKRAKSSILITSEEINKCGSPSRAKVFSTRTHNCGELREGIVGTAVTLCGWVENKRSDRFMTLRDGYGFSQIVIPQDDPAVHSVVTVLKPDDIVTVQGTVCLRPVHQRNTSMATGSVEVKLKSIRLIDPNEVYEEPGEDIEMKNTDDNIYLGNVNSYSGRSHTCGELKGSDVGKEVELCGWLEFQRMNKFGIIRDGYGSTQMFIPPKMEHISKMVAETPLESVIRVKGIVCGRPKDQISHKMSTGEIEVMLSEYEVLNPAKKNLPFLIRDHNKAKENLRMKYRYMDLRFPQMQYNLRLRSSFLMRMREFLINERQFVEVETPTLFRRTPGGAQEYVVPTRNEGQFYSLVQSPQQLKQLLMVGAIDRYFQIARCYRDEGARPDRQPEFTQLDIEMSFTNKEGVLKLIEEMLASSWPQELGKLTLPFPRMTYQEAMELYGSDKPDISFDNKIQNLDSIVNKSHETISNVLRSTPDFSVRGLVIPGGAKLYTSSVKAELEKYVQDTYPLSRLYVFKMSDDKWESGFSKALPYLKTDDVKDKLKFTSGDLVFVATGRWDHALQTLGKLRLDMQNNKEQKPNVFKYLWVVDFPLFLPGETAGSLESAHHPFTQPHPDDVHLIDSDPLKVRGLHYDLVLNGCEIAGGSIRVHCANLQRHILNDILHIPTDTLEHLLEALDSGAPPHGGIALGIDRLISIMVGAISIRDVIAFPKGVDGKDPLSGAPCGISPEEIQLYHLAPKLSNDEKKTRAASH